MKVIKPILDFFVSALPWVAIGLFAANFFAIESCKSAGKRIGKHLLQMSWFPAVCFLVLAVVDFLEGNKSSGTTWPVLSAANATINFANTQHDKP